MLTEAELLLLRDENTAKEETERICKEEFEKDKEAVSERALRAQFELLFVGIRVMSRGDEELARKARTILRDAFGVSAEMIIHAEEIHEIKARFSKIFAESYFSGQSEAMH